MVFPTPQQARGIHNYIRHTSIQAHTSHDETAPYAHSVCAVLITIALIIIIIARPQGKNSWKNSQVEGIDIMLAIDASTSMLAEDLQPNRIQAAKSVATEFISARPNDNIGLTVFAAEAYTQ